MMNIRCHVIVAYIYIFTPCGGLVMVAKRWYTEGTEEVKTMVMNYQELYEWAAADYFKQQAARQPDQSRWIPPPWERVVETSFDDDRGVTHTVVKDKYGKVWREETRPTFMWRLTHKGE